MKISDKLRSIADASRREDGSDIPLGAQCREGGDEIDRLRAELADANTSIIAFCAPWAAEFAKLHGLDGLHPTHYDILEKAGARMEDFKRAFLPSQSEDVA